MSDENNGKIEETSNENNKNNVPKKIPAWMWVMMIIAAVFWIFVMTQQ